MVTENSTIVHKVKKGLYLPGFGKKASGSIDDVGTVSRIAVIADDFVGLKPSMKVKVGDKVRRGQPLFEDRSKKGVVFTSWACGEIESINRGERRKLESIIIKLLETSDEEENEVEYSSYKKEELKELKALQVKALLQESGMWTSLRIRPFGVIPDANDEFAAFFITAMDTNPLAPEASLVINEAKTEFEAGLAAIGALADGKPVYLCKSATENLSIENYYGAKVHEFSGPHPSGTPGFHIHSISPATPKRKMCYVGYQDVIAIGHLMLKGKLKCHRVISIAGPGVSKPILLKTRLGAEIAPLVTAAGINENDKILSGSVLSGRIAEGDITGFIGRYENQITLLQKDSSRRFLGWLAPGFKTFSLTRLFASAFLPRVSYKYSDDQFGGERTMIPFSCYDRVNAFNVMPVFLLRAILAQDIETAEKLGALEFVEEDLALFTFVCPSKNEYGPALRKMLTQVYKEGL